MENDLPREGPLPVHAVLGVIGATSIIIGVLWDISWHSTIGRDTFWTPAHLAIYLGGVLAGTASGWALFRATFPGSGREPPAGVRILGCRGPLGAWVTVWGALAMITSAPFDNWWHNAYGLDVEILSPPHSVLAAGMFGIALGALFLVLSAQNRAELERRGRPALLASYTAGILLTMAATFLTERSLPNQQHAASFYKHSSLVYPLFLVVAARASAVRWPATAAAATYMAFVLAMAWILPLFSARPLLAPIYNPVDRMVPPAFPLLLVAPALSIDLLLRSWAPAPGRWRDWLLAPALGAAFLAVFLAVQWSISLFLISPAADNAFFVGGRFFPYSEQLGEWKHRFWEMGIDPLTPKDLGTALVLAVLSALGGLGVGRWMGTVKR
jgi:hypothetical protein